MATWIAHMRIAEAFMEKYPVLCNDEFLVGNIGPDCGVPNEDWSSFTPDKYISHWMPDKKNIDAEDFRKRYLAGDTSEPFLTGYYFHLLADIEWGKLYARKRGEKIYAEGLARDPNFIWTIKKDWYGQDHLYLKRNPGHVFFTRFVKISEFENRFFDFYPPEAFTRQIHYISGFYQSAEEDESRKFPFLRKEEMDGFVESAVIEIEDTYRLLMK